MKVQQILPQLQNNNYKEKNQQNQAQPNFGNAYAAFTTGLRFLDTNQAWGANAVDLCSMVIPRTSVDMVNRGPDAGMETARREGSGTINHSLVGLYGTIGGIMLAGALNSKFGVKAQKMFVDDDTLKTLGDTWTAQIKSGSKDTLHDYLQTVFKNAQTRVGDEWKNIPQENIDDIVSKFTETLKNKENAPITITKDLKEYAQSVITHVTGSENGFRLTKESQPTTLSNMLDGVYNVTRAFSAKEINVDDFLKSMQKMNRNRALIGLGIASAIGMSIQPLNIYLTKKKTGSDGFVGVEGREKDKSNGFKAMKATAAAGFMALALATIGFKGGVSGIMKKLQYKGLNPTLDQYKFIYGMTIMSRFMAARDKDELREAAVKDTLGFFNWLILGNFVAKMVANSMDQNLLNYSEKEHGKGFFNKIFKAPMVTRDEVLHRGLKACGIDSVENGKALSFKNLLKKLDDTKVTEAVRKETKGKLRALSIAQIAGYLYSGIILGFGIPKLNIYMTNKSEAKRKAKLAAEKAKQSETQPNVQTQFTSMNKPEMKELLK